MVQLLVETLQQQQHTKKGYTFSSSHSLFLINLKPENRSLPYKTLIVSLSTM